MEQIFQKLVSKLDAIEEKINKLDSIDASKDKEDMMQCSIDELRDCASLNDGRVDSLELKLLKLEKALADENLKFAGILESEGDQKQMKEKEIYLVSENATNSVTLRLLAD